MTHALTRQREASDGSKALARCTCGRGFYAVRLIDALGLHASHLRAMRLAGKQVSDVPTWLDKPLANGVE